ncbi:MAG: polysaccharide pyruvyl transferase family protein [Bacteroidota bacterium]|jgi:hypothetical protein
MKTICIFDTSIATRNPGDQMIMDSVQKIIGSLFRDGLQVRVGTHEPLQRPSRYLIKHSDIKIIGGTNLLSSDMLFHNQWKVSLLDAPFLSDTILLGVGWWQYQRKPNLYTKILLNHILSKRFIHSVRDGYTKKMLNSIGIKNVINTSCPTMWGLTKEHCRRIPSRKSEKVLFTLTSYRPDKNQDIKLIKQLLESYKNVFFWPQGQIDYSYFREINKFGDRINLLSPSIFQLDSFLKRNATDYVGTRLHAGIKALTFAKRSLIVGIDNRSLEIAKDTNLTVIKRQNIDGIKKWIYASENTDINLPLDAIQKWKNQFHEPSDGV